MSNAKIVEDKISDDFSKFTLSPLFKGFGVVFGNVVRRSMYSMRGVKVDWFSIVGVPHQFSSIDGVVEDVISISLAMQNVIFNAPSLDGSETVNLSVSGKIGQITAGDIICGDNVSIVNKDLVLFTVSKDVSLKMIISIKSGFGVEIISGEDDVLTNSAGKVYLNKYYTPVKNVSFEVSDVIHNGDAKSFESVVVEVRTNGEITPLESIEIASAISSSLFDSVVKIAGESVKNLKDDIVANSASYGSMSKSFTGMSDISSSVARSKSDALISHVEFSVRTMNCLRGMSSVRYISDLEKFTQRDLLSKKNFGKKSLKEVEHRMMERGFALKIDEDGEYID